MFFIRGLLHFQLIQPWLLNQEGIVWVQVLHVEADQLSWVVSLLIVTEGDETRILQGFAITLVIFSPFSQNFLEDVVATFRIPLFLIVLLGQHVNSFNSSADVK